MAEILDIKQIYSSATGPLARLESSAFAGALQYPLNLGAEHKKHWVQFDILTFERADSGPGTPISKIMDKISQFAESVSTEVGVLGKAVKDGTATTEKVSNSVSNIANSPALQAVVPKLEETIVLYTPDTLDFTQSAHYNETSYQKMIQDAGSSVSGNSLTSKVLGSAASVFDPNDTAKLLLSKMGYAFNPQLQLLFDGIDFRTYSMSFTFTPYSRQEAENVRQIVNRFRYHAAPTIVKGNAGFFFRPPSVFDLKFYSGGSENRYINKVQRSVLESVNVNYAPNGWSAYSDGSPTQMTMQLNFKEISLVDKGVLSTSVGKV